MAFSTKIAVMLILPSFVLLTCTIVVGTLLLVTCSQVGVGCIDKMVGVGLVGSAGCLIVLALVCNLIVYWCSKSKRPSDSATESTQE